MSKQVTNGKNVKRKLFNDSEACSSKKTKTVVEYSASKNGKETTSKGKKLNTKNVVKLVSKILPKKRNLKGNNNNAVPSNCQDRSSLGKNDKYTGKVNPIIQTRGMKAKALLTNKNNENELVRQQESVNLSEELDKLNSIDELSSCEIADGGLNEVDHDGVELSVNGSDDEFTAEEANHKHSDHSDDDLDAVTTTEESGHIMITSNDYEDELERI